MGPLKRLKRLLRAMVSKLPLAKQLKDVLLSAIRHLQQSSSSRLHDIFNLVSIGAINLLNFANLHYQQGFMPLFLSTMLYTVADILFITVWPESVKSPTSIVVHHLITAAYMFVPLLLPQHRWFFSWALLVEANTWTQIARRTLPIPGLNTLFYATWVGLRLVMYPILSAVVWREWWRSAATLAQRDTVLLLSGCMQTFLTGMNYYWSAQLLCKMSARRKRNITAVRSQDKQAAAQVHLNARATAADSDKDA
jgi:hypothetical protein